MEIPPEIGKLIARARQQNPQLVQLPDEEVAELITQAMQKQQGEPPTNEEELKKMHPEQLGVIGERMIDKGHWEKAEKYLLMSL